MAARVTLHPKWPYAFALLVSLLGLWLLAGSASAGLLTDTITPGKSAPLNDAYMVLLPEGSAPPNGGSATVGDRFVLGLWLEPGSHTDATAQQSYLTFTWPLLQNARVSSIATACVLTETVAADTTTFDTVLQNAVCNNPYVFCGREHPDPPGSISYAIGCLGQCYYVGRFRVAQVGLCAVAAGTAVLHWQFAPPDPLTRDTEIVDVNSNIISNRALFTDYIINITTPTATPTITPTPTATSTPVPGSGCRLSIPTFYACMDTNLCGSFAVRLRNEGDTTVVVEGTAQLIARSGVVMGEYTFPTTSAEPHVITFMGGTICPSGFAPGPYHVDVTIQTVGGSCPPRHKSQRAVEGCT